MTDEQMEHINTKRQLMGSTPEVHSLELLLDIANSILIEPNKLKVAAFLRGLIEEETASTEKE